MKDNELRKQIGSRIKQRRLELNLGQQYIAEKMDVNKSTIQRYESGTIDNSKKWILKGLAEALHVSVEWLKGETEEYETDIMDQKELQILDAMHSILEHSPFRMQTKESDFLKDLLLLMLNEYAAFTESFQTACEKYKGIHSDEKLVKAIGFESEKDFLEIGFLKEITHTIHIIDEVSDILRTYNKNPEIAAARLQNLLSQNSESV